MNVEQLIKRLSKFDPKSTIAVVDSQWSDYANTNPVVVRVRLEGDASIVGKGEYAPEAESVVLITFKGAAGTESYR